MNIQQKNTYMERQQNWLNGFEIVRNRKCLVHNILNANDAATAQLLFDQLIGIESGSFVVNNQETMLEDHIANSIDVWIAPDNVGFDELQQRRCLRVIGQENCIVKLI